MIVEEHRDPHDPDTASPARVLPPVYFFVAILAMVMLHWLAPMVRIVPYPWNLIGAAIIVLGLIPPLTGAAYFRKHGTTIRPFQVSDALVTAGVYRFSRNPMYLGLVVILTGIAIGLGSLSPWIVVPVFVVLITRRFIVHEERMLTERFGEAYTDYQRRVRRWI